MASPPPFLVERKAHLIKEITKTYEKNYKITSSKKF